MAGKFHPIANSPLLFSAEPALFRFYVKMFHRERVYQHVLEKMGLRIKVSKPEGKG
ncbi:MAG: hypothetical protein AABY93_00240 [Bacteroidota bacterium]